jgi:hypothetical protein
MVVSHVDDDLLANTMDVIEEETTTQSGIVQPHNPGTYYTLYIHGFVSKHVHDKMTEVEEMLVAHDNFSRNKID